MNANEKANKKKMDEKVSMHVGHDTMKCSPRKVVFFTTREDSVEVFDTLHCESSVISCKFPIRDVAPTGKHIYIFGENRIHNYSSETCKLLSRIIVPNFMGFIRLKDQYSLVYTKDDMILFDGSARTVWKESYRYVQAIEDYLVVVFVDRVSVYKSLEGEAYSVSREEFEEQFYPVFKKPETKDGLKKISFSIHNRKLYLLVDDRIVGRDLNVYLDDLNKYSKQLKEARIGKFQCVSKALILLDESQEMLYMVSKSLEDILFATKCSDFYYNTTNDNLFIFYDKKFKVLEQVSEFKQPFKLTDKNIIYKESEDEFDESENSSADMCV